MEEQLHPLVAKVEKPQRSQNPTGNMEASLSPYFLLADKLMPQWHVSVCSNGADNHQRESHPPMSFSLRAEPDGQEAARRQQLRDTLTAFAVSYKLNAFAFAAAVCSYKKLDITDCLPVDESSPRLRLKVLAAVGSKSYGDAVDELTAFFSQWGDHTPSEEPQRSLGVPTSDGLIGTRSPVFDLSVELELLSEETFHSRVFDLVKMVRSINRAVFNITDVTLRINYADYADAAWEELLLLLHWLRRDANIHFQATLPRACGIGFPPLVQWKRRFDLLTRAPSTDTQSPNSKQWNVALTYGRPEYATSSAARVILSSLSALTHSTTTISSLSLSYVLQRDGGTRYAKALGYLLQADVTENLQWTDRLSTADMDAIESIISAPTQAKRLQRLWCADWRDDGLDRIAKIRETVADDSQFIGVMHDDARDDCVDVHLVGLGQCRVSRRLTNTAIQKLESRVTTVPELAPARLLKSLTLKLEETNRECVVRLIVLLGSSLEELVINTASLRFDLASLVAMLDACPKLQRLSIRSLHLKTRDDTFQPTQEPLKVYPLKSLSADVVLNDAASGLLGFAQLIKLQTPQLTECRLHATELGPFLRMFEDHADAVARMFNQRHSPAAISLSSLISTEAILANQPMETLELDGFVFADWAWNAVVDALCSDDHLIARSLHTLAIRVDDPQGTKTQDILRMLERNHFLVDVLVVFQRRSDAASAPLVNLTNGAGVHRRKAPLSIRQKLALLSVVQRMGLPENSDALSGVFVYGAPAITRRVRLSSLQQ